jgi:hypothetical protein
MRHGRRPQAKTAHDGATLRHSPLTSWHWPELRTRGAAAQPRMVSVVRIRLDSHKSMRPFKAIIATTFLSSNPASPATQSGLPELGWKTLADIWRGLAIDQAGRCPERKRCARDQGKAPGPVVSVAGEKPHARRVAAHEHSEAVVFDLVQPPSPSGRLRGKRPDRFSARAPSSRLLHSSRAAPH